MTPFNKEGVSSETQHRQDGEKTAKVQETGFDEPEGNLFDRNKIAVDSSNEEEDMSIKTKTTATVDEMIAEVHHSKIELPVTTKEETLEYTQTNAGKTKVSGAK